MSGKTLVEQIRHYQKDIERCPENSERMIRCIQRLYVLPILVQHLQETGVGRSVNSLRKYSGEVGDAAKALVAKWKAMVAAEESSEGEQIQEPMTVEEVKPPPSPVITQKRVKEKEKVIEKHHSESNRHCERNGDKHRSDKNKHHSHKRSHSNSKQENDHKSDRKTSDRHKHSHKGREQSEDEDDSSPTRKRKKPCVKSEARRSRTIEESESESSVDGDDRSQSDRGVSEERSDSEDQDKSEDETSEESDRSSDHRHRSKHHKSHTSSKSSHSSKDFHNSSSNSSNGSNNCKKNSSSSSSSRHSSKNSSSHDLKELIKENEKKVKKEKESKDVKISKASLSKVKIERNEDGSIDQGSGASFADALLGVGSMSAPKKKKKVTVKEEKSPSDTSSSSKHSKSSSSTTHSKSSSQKKSFDPFKEPDILSKNFKLEPLDIDISSTLPEILPTYKPLPHVPEHAKKNNLNKNTIDEETMFSLMTTKNLRTKVYSGAKTGVFMQVPTLYSLCLTLLYENIDALEYTGGVPFDILKPLLEKLNADQLYVLEHYNHYLIEDTDSLWQFHCKKDFRGEKTQDMESWRDLYLRCMDERERKLKALTANINQSIAKSTPVRTAKLAYVDSVAKPPRSVARTQARFGTGNSSSSSNASLTSNAATKHQIVSKAIVGGHTPGLQATVVVPPPPSSGPKHAPQLMKKKKAPLMAKALQLIKGNRFKR